MRGFSAKVAVLAAVLACAGCASSRSDDPGGQAATKTPDTCTQGENMSSPRFSKNPERVGDTTELNIVWDAGTGVGERLPEAYFERASGAPGTAVRKVEKVGPRELHVVLEGGASGEAPVRFSLAFPDRRDFVDCTHGGMADAYFLDVEYWYPVTGAGIQSTFAQRVALGDY